MGFLLPVGTANSKEPGKRRRVPLVDRPAPAPRETLVEETGQLARDAGVHKLLLTHILPWTDRHAVFADASEAFPGPVEVVEDGDAFEI